MTPRPMVPPSRGMRLVAEIRRGWKPPRLTAAGKPFAPTGVEVGAWVAWDEREPVRSLSGIPTGEQRTLERVGQVWAPCHLRGHVFVVDLEQRAHELPASCLRPAAEPGEQLALTG